MCHVVTEKQLRFRYVANKPHETEMNGQGNNFPADSRYWYVRESVDPMHVAWQDIGKKIFKTASGIHLPAMF